MGDRQIEELVKLYLDIGKLIFASLVLGFFQSGLDIKLVLSYGLIGLTFSIGFFTMGIQLLRGVK